MLLDNIFNSKMTLRKMGVKTVAFTSAAPIYFGRKSSLEKSHGRVFLIIRGGDVRTSSTPLAVQGNPPFFSKSRSS